MISCIYMCIFILEISQREKTAPTWEERQAPFTQLCPCSCYGKSNQILLHSVIQFITSISAGLIPSNISAYPPAVPFATQDDTSFILLYWTTEQPSLFQMLWNGGREDESPKQFRFKTTRALFEVWRRCKQNALQWGHTSLL